jgi:hypothetical protein
METPNLVASAPERYRPGKKPESYHRVQLERNLSEVPLYQVV